MKYDQNFFENLVAEIIARFLLGAIGAIVAITLPFRYLGSGLTRGWFDVWETLGWRSLAIPIAGRLFYAILGIRKGPGVI